MKISIIAGQVKDFEYIENILKEEYVPSLILVGNGNKPARAENVHCKKLQSPGSKNNELSHNR